MPQDRGGGKILVDARLEFDVKGIQTFALLPERLVEPAERRSAIARNETAGIQSRRLIADPLQNRQQCEGLDAGQEMRP